MLRITLPHAHAWNTWYADTDNTPAGVAPLRAIVDEACRDVGRDPAEIERTVAVQVRLPGGTGRTMGDTTTSRRIAPLEGSPERMADELRAYAARGDRRRSSWSSTRSTAPSIERFAPVLPLVELDRG